MVKIKMGRAGSIPETKWIECLSQAFAIQWESMFNWRPMGCKSHYCVVVIFSAITIFVAFSSSIAAPQTELVKAEALRQKGIRLFDQGRYHEAIPLAEEALTITEKVLGANHPDVAIYLNDLAMLFSKAGRNDDADPLYKRGLVILESVYGQHHPEVSTALNNLAEHYYRTGDYNKGIQLGERALGIDEKHFGPEHEYTASDLNTLALLYKAKGDYTIAEAHYKRALSILEKIKGPDHPAVAAALNNIAVLYETTAEYEKAERLYKRALTIKIKTLGPDHPKTAVGHNNLGEHYIYTGEYEKAEYHLEKALDIKKKAYGTEHPGMAAGLHNLAFLHYSLGDYEKAETLFKNAVKISRKTLGREHPHTALGLSYLAELYRSQGNYKMAAYMAKRSLGIMEKALGPEHHALHRELTTLGLIYLKTGDYDKAEVLLKRIRNSCEKALGEEHPDFATSLSNLAGLYKTRGEYEKAEPLHQRALAIREKVLGKLHPETAASLHNLALLYTAMGLYERANDLAGQALEIDKRTIDHVMGFSSADRMLKFLRDRRRTLDSSLCLVSSFLRQNEQARVNALNWWLHRKGIILEAQKRFQEALVYSDNPEAARVLHQLAQRRARLSRLTFKGPGSGDPETYRNNITDLQSEIEELEARLSRLSRTYALQKKVKRADFATLAEALPPDSALIEFARINVFDFKAKGKEEKWLPAKYLVFIVKAGDKDQAGLFDLGPADPIDQAAASLKRSVINPKKQKKTASASVKLYNLVFARIRKQLGQIREIYISPDGDLNLIPFEILQGPDGRYLIEDYTFNYLAAGRDILLFGQTDGKAGPPLLIGDPDFNLGVDEKAEALRQLSGMDQLNENINEMRSADMRGIQFNKLPGTREEINEIQALLGYDMVITRTGREALEEVLVGLKEPPRILHIATHGFFLSDQQLNIFLNSNSYGLELFADPKKKIPANPDIRFENPLLRSGLALAGANNALKSDDTKQCDGLLTAEKVLGLRLHGTELVVLSACNTGMGEVRSGEGVYGLRRAFIQAGVKGLVMSMWSVPDKETKELMVRFYKNILGGKMNKAQAIRHAALHEMEVVKKRYGLAHPLFWGAFIFLGQPYTVKP